MSYCKCKQPKKLRNEAHGVAFDVCAKSLGGCGEEISTGKLPLFADIIKPSKSIKADRAEMWINGKKIGEITNLVVDPIGSTKVCDGPCEFNCCGKPAERTRQNTQYVDEERNYGTFCEEHQVEVDEYWAEMWKDYWSDRI